MVVCSEGLRAEPGRYVGRVAVHQQNAATAPCGASRVWTFFCARRLEDLRPGASRRVHSLEVPAKQARSSNAPCSSNSTAAEQHVHGLLRRHASLPPAGGVGVLPRPGGAQPSAVRRPERLDHDVHRGWARVRHASVGRDANLALRPRPLAAGERPSPAALHPRPRRAGRTHHGSSPAHTIGRRTTAAPRSCWNTPPAPRSQCCWRARCPRPAPGPAAARCARAPPPPSRPRWEAGAASSCCGPPQPALSSCPTTR